MVYATDGPLTPIMNLGGRTDENGYLRISAGSPGVVDGPLTPIGNLRGRTDENGYLRVACLDCTSGTAPSNATYITQTLNASLSNEQALASLATGILKSTTTTGVVSIAVAGDLPGGPYCALAGCTMVGSIQAPDGSSSVAAYGFSSSVNSGFSYGSGPNVDGYVNGTLSGRFGTNGDFVVNQRLSIGSGQDANLLREAANYLIQRNSTSAQRLSVAKSYISATSGQLVSLDAGQTNANVAIIGSRTLSTGGSVATLFGGQASNGVNRYAGFAVDEGSAAGVIRIGFYGSDITPPSIAQANPLISLADYTNTATSGSPVAVRIIPTYNQASGTAANTDLLINRTEIAIGSGVQRLFAGQIAGVDQFALSRVGKATYYGAVATAGWGQPAIYGSGRVTAQTAAASSIATYTVGAADGSFIVNANINVTNSTTHNFGVVVTYTDETNTSRSLTLPVAQLAGTVIAAITNITGAGPYEGIGLQIRCKAGTAITITTAGTFTSVTYNGEGSILQVS